MFILLDVERSKLKPYRDHVDGIDELEVKTLAEMDEEPEYYTGVYHVVDTLEAIGELSRWRQLVLASNGVRVFSDTFNKDSPLYAGEVPSPDDSTIRKISVDATFADTRAALVFSETEVDYIGRTKLDPRNVFILDWSAANPIFDPKEDPDLTKLYSSLAEDWWVSCGLVAAPSTDKLEKFFEVVPTPIPIVFTNSAEAKAKFLGLDFVRVSPPTGSPQWGIEVRDRANRLSYELSEPEPLPEVEDKYNFGI